MKKGFITYGSYGFGTVLFMFIFIAIIILVGYSYLKTGSFFEGINHLLGIIISNPIEILIIFLLGMILGYLLRMMVY